jgi:hypothetical protein
VGVGDFFDFPLFLIVDDDWRRRGLEVSRDWGISGCCGFQQQDVKCQDLYFHTLTNGRQRNVFSDTALQFGFGSRTKASS